MKVAWQGFAGTNHSWSIVAQSICRSLAKKGHEVHLCSTNGYDFFPEDLRPLVRDQLDDDYDMQLTYTALKNAPLYLGRGDKNRFLCWTFEFAGKNALPEGFAKNYKFTDKILPPSNFAKQVFLDSGIPESHMAVVPHGIDFQLVDSAIPYQLKTNKSTKILAVIAQVHRRKNLAGMLDMYGKAFTKKDDVCLVLKVQDRPPKQTFELSFKDLFTQFKTKYKDHAEVEIVREFVPNIYSLYKSCDIVFSASHCEGFGITALDAHALGKINVASKYGGFLDFLNPDNSLLIDGSEFSVPTNFLYWTNKTNTKAFMPSIDAGVAQLRFAVENKETLLTKYTSNIGYAQNNYNWDTVTNQIIGLTDYV
jgi:glycosyltransferase involved in cell wall biosynthesis